MDQDARLEAVEIENEKLRARVEQLEREIGMRWRAPIEFRLTGSESRVLGIIVERDMMTKNMAMFALYDDLHRDPAEEKIVDVFVCKLRKKLKPFGIAIETIWGSGYRMKAEHKRAIAEMLAKDAA